MNLVILGWTALLPLALAFAVAVVLTPLVRLSAERLGWYAHPVPNRWHRRPVALLGGVAIATAVFLSLWLSGEWRTVWPLLIPCGLMFALGLADDVRKVRPVPKLIGQMLVAALLIFLAPPVVLTGFPIVDQLLAFAWIIGITNAFNLLDNIDGLAAGVAAIAGLFYLLVLAPEGQSAMIPAAAAFVGAAAGFLVYNFQPASIFMGDGGSLFLGSFLASVSLLAAPGFQAKVASVAAVPLLILLVPIFDTAFVTLTRGFQGRSALIGGRDHTSHRLVALGISERQAVLTLYALATLGGIVALGVHEVSFGYAAILIVLYLTVVAGLGIVLGHVQTSRDGGVEIEVPNRTPLVSELTYRYRRYEVLLDTVLIGVAYYAGLRVRFQEPEFSHFLPYFITSFPVVVGTQLTALWWMGKYRQTWSAFGATELLTILRGIAVGVAGSVVLLLYLYRFEGFSRWTFVIDATALSFLLVGSRVVITRVDEYLRRQRARGDLVLIYGAGLGGSLLVREILQNANLGLTPFGFLDDDPIRRSLKVEGVPIVGGLVDLPRILERHRIAEVLIAIRDLPAEQLDVLQSLCREHGVRVRRMQFELISLEARADAASATLHERSRRPRGHRH